MLRKTLVALALCALPLSAESIGASANFTFNLQTDYPDFHSDSVSGTNDLHYSQSNGIGITDSADVAFHGDVLTGSISIAQGHGAPVPYPPGSQTTGQLLATVNIPSSSGVTISGSETVLDNDISTNTQFLSSILVNGVTTPFPIKGNLGYPSQTTTLFVPNPSGNPLTIGLEFNPAVNAYFSGDYISFYFTFSQAPNLAATPEPATWGMLGIVVLAFPFLGRKIRA